MLLKKIENPIRTHRKKIGRSRRENPSAFGTLVVLGLVGAGAYAAWKALGDDAKPAQGCSVTFTEQSLNTEASRQIMMTWIFKWGASPNSPARDAAIDLMKKLAPQCQWSPTSDAVIHRADGTTITWSEVLHDLGDRSTGDVGDDLIAALFGSQPQSFGQPTLY